MSQSTGQFSEKVVLLQIEGPGRNSGDEPKSASSQSSRRSAQPSSMRKPASAYVSPLLRTSRCFQGPTYPNSTIAAGYSNFPRDFYVTVRPAKILSRVPSNNVIMPAWRALAMNLALTFVRFNDGLPTLVEKTRDAAP
jgi:hypothetical protein